MFNSGDIKMKKIVLILTLGALILSSIAVSGVLDKISEKTSFIEFSKPEFQNKEGYLMVHLDKTNSYLNYPDKPRLPIHRETFKFSRNTKIKDVIVRYSNIIEEDINAKIIPAPRVNIEGYTQTVKLYEDEETYNSYNMFPGSWYTYSIRCGLDDNGIQTTFVTVEIHPIQYIPAEDKIYYMKNAEIEIVYNDPNETPASATYDLVIIAPSEFSKALQPLVDHKNNVGIKTILKTTDEIYQEYNGRDKPEQIKYCIKDALENWGIRYVLLVGGLKSYLYAEDKDGPNEGSKDWYVPVRYTRIHLPGGGEAPDEYGCISDLYYADIYKYNESSQNWEFEDWDSNHNGIFAEWPVVGSNDVLDLIPDVYVGRLACRNINEVNILVDKIINYESASPDEKPWFKKMIGIAGKTFDIYNGQPDGEYLCDIAFNYMDDLIDPIRVYASNRDTGGLCPVPEDISKAISEGAGYVLFEGHGNPMLWDTIWADGEYPKDWAGGLSTLDFWKLKNKDKLPIILVGGCHNGLFNISIMKILLNRKTNYNYYWTWYPTPFCFSWGLCVLPKGGAIASTGCTGYGLGWDDDPLSLNAELEVDFYYEIGQNNATTLGEAHGGSIEKFVIENPMEQIEEYHAVTVYQLFGDPSLKLGGYLH
ncbi:MAG TPA: hypothetical protein ENI44_02765 [Thermoplasmatales archaeon]|nr:hypothetical protein [Thermoplasmatales archaeon]